MSEDGALAPVPRLSELIEQSPRHPPPGDDARGADLRRGGGMCFELVCDVAGEFPFVNHGFGHGQKGAIGFLVVEG